MPVETSHPDRVLFPEEPAAPGGDEPGARGARGRSITKGDMVDYYRRVGPVMVPHLRGRPLMLERYPEGITRPGVYQKEAPAHFPDWVHRVEVPKEGGTVNHAVCNDEDTLVYLANQGSLTFHAWLSRADRIYHPDQLIFDLDPPPGAFDTVRAAARHLGEILDGLELVPFVKTTGSRGLHVVVPLDRSATFDETRAFARDVAALVVAGDPGRLTTEVRKAKRGGRVFVDVLRNGYAQTAVAPYSVRARPRAPVATPVDWEELGKGHLDPGRYTIRNLFRRLGRKPDPWRDMAGQARPLEPARRRLEPLARRVAS
ncbi:MAG: non-homologous end-joining DNA ligase [Actinomycetota bacterium]|nr:non-homologous end-joining DNA ligase [Actinomycetota bacterium]